MTAHTVKTLGKYIGSKVQIYLGKEKMIVKLYNVSVDGQVMVVFNDFFNRDFSFTMPENVYPVLKDYKALIEPMQFEGKTILPIEYVYGGNALEDVDSDFQNKNTRCEYSLDGGFDTITLKKLHDLNFGAIESKESPTNCVDLWGNWCVNERDLK